MVVPVQEAASKIEKAPLLESWSFENNDSR